MDSPSPRNTLPAMNWGQYVRSHAGGDLNRVVASRAGVSEANVSRWKAGAQLPRAEHVAAFARAYGRPVLEAFIAAGYLTAEEANARPAAAPDYTQLTNRELIELVYARMREDSESDDDPPTSQAGVRPAHSGHLVSEEGRRVPLDESASRTAPPAEQGPGLA